MVVSFVSPRFDGGSGLKHGVGVPGEIPGQRLPSFRRGERIETLNDGIYDHILDVSPRFDGGSGLKLQYLHFSLLLSLSPLVSTGGAD